MRILLGITTHLNLSPDRLEVLKLVIDSAAISGADDWQVITVGSNEKAEALLNPLGRRWIRIAENPGPVQGEVILTWRLMQEGEARGAEWVLKVAGDCIHSAQNWAKAWCSIPEGQYDAIIIGDQASPREEFTATKVYGCKPSFLRRIWQTTWTANLEMSLRDSIRRVGLLDRVFRPLSERIYEYGNALYMRPISPAFRFIHAHTLLAFQRQQIADDVTQTNTLLELGLAERSRNVAANNEHLYFVRDTALALNAQRVIEVGVYAGNFTIALLAALEKTGGFLYSCDCQEYGETRLVIDKLDGTKHWRFIVADDILWGLTHPIHDLDLVVIDSSHRRLHTEQELALFAPRVRPGGMILLHDTITFPDVTAAIESWRKRNPEWTYRNRTNNNGLGVLTWVPTFLADTVPTTTVPPTTIPATTTIPPVMTYNIIDFGVGIIRRPRKVTA